MAAVTEYKINEFSILTKNGRNYKVLKNGSVIGYFTNLVNAVIEVFNQLMLPGSGDDEIIIEDQMETAKYEICEAVWNWELV